MILKIKNYKGNRKLNLKPYLQIINNITLHKYVATSKHDISYGAKAVKFKVQYQPKNMFNKIYKVCK